MDDKVRCATTDGLGCRAHETSVANKRSTITLKDVVQTLRDADFEHFIEPIEACLQGGHGLFVWMVGLVGLIICVVVAAESKASAARKKNQKAMVEEEEGEETANEVTEQLDEVAIEEDADEGMMAVDQPSENEDDAEEDTEEKGTADGAMRDEAKTEEADSPTAQADEDEDAEAMEQS
jgi:hypothetical protein